MSYKDPKKHKASGFIGNLQVEFEGEQYEKLPILDTKVSVGGGTNLSCITWADKEKFLSELNEVISKYRI